MKHHFLGAIPAAVLITVIHSAQAQGASQAVKQAVEQALPNTPIDSIRPTGIPGLFEVVAGRNLFYTSASGSTT